jgi:hypothetical protein
LKSAECWGLGPFDNFYAQDLAFKISSDPRCKNLNFLADRIQTPIRSLQDCFEFIALAELANMASGQSTHGPQCPMLLDWILKHKVKPPTDQVKHDIAEKLRSECATAKFLKTWKDSSSAWQTEIETIAAILESGKKPRAVKKDEIAIKTLTTLVINRPGREPDSLYPMDRGSKDMHINFSYADPQTAIAMTRYPSVVSLSLILRQISDEANNIVPFKILLRRWLGTIYRLNCDVTTKKWHSRFLDHCIPELELLSKLEIFKSVQFEISDSVLQALARSKKLKEIRISCEKNGPTVASLNALKAHPSLRILWLRGSRISQKAATAFADAHPKVNVDIA